MATAVQPRAASASQAAGRNAPFRGSQEPDGIWLKRSLSSTGTPGAIPLRTRGFTASRTPLAADSVRVPCATERHGRWVVPIARVVASVADETLRADTALACSMPWQLPSGKRIRRREGHNCCVLTPPDRGTGRVTSRLCEALWRSTRNYVISGSTVEVSFAAPQTELMGLL